MKTLHKLLVVLILMGACSKDDDVIKVKDIDGNLYNLVTIGTQVWMVENLKTTRYNDGTDIPFVTDNAAWNALNTPGYCWYDNDKATYKNTYGALYNWYTVESEKLCPSGWHVPSEAEWEQLIDYSGGLDTAGGKLKEAGTTHWNDPNTDATNETGFTALPGGIRWNTGLFVNFGENGVYWSVNEYDTYYAICFGTGYDHSYVNITNHHKRLGCSVRCVMD